MLIRLFALFTNLGCLQLITLDFEKLHVVFIVERYTVSVVGSIWMGTQIKQVTHLYSCICIVDQNIKSSILFLTNFIKQLFHLLIIFMVTFYRDTLARWVLANLYSHKRTLWLTGMSKVDLYIKNLRKMMELLGNTNVIYTQFKKTCSQKLRGLIILMIKTKSAYPLNDPTVHLNVSWFCWPKAKTPSGLNDSWLPCQKTTFTLSSLVKLLIYCKKKADSNPFMGH